MLLGACIAGGAAFAVPGDIGAAPDLGPAAGDCVEGAVTAVSTIPCGYGMLAGPQFVADMTWLGQALALKIEKGDAEIQAGQTKIIAAMGKMADAQVARRNQTIRNQTATQEALRLAHLSGPLGGIQDVCASSNVADTILSGRGGYTNFRVGLNQAMVSWPSSFNSTHQVLETLSAAGGQNQQGLPTSNIYSPASAGSAAQFISVVNGGMPREYIDPSKLPATARTSYLAHQTVWSTREGVANEALQHVAAKNKATMQTSPWVSASYAAIGVPAPEKLSERQLDKILAERQIDSPGWRTHIAQLDTVGVLREIAMMKAASLKIHYDQLSDLDRLLVLTAAIYAHQVQGERPIPQASELGQPSTQGGS